MQEMTHRAVTPSPEAATVEALTAALAERDERLARLAAQSALRQDLHEMLLAGMAVEPLLDAAIEAVVRRLGAVFGRIWLYRPEPHALELMASAGTPPTAAPPAPWVPVGQYVVGHIAATRQAYHTNDAVHDPLLAALAACHADHGIVAMAGHPLLVEQRLVGVMAIFARCPLPADHLDALASIADALALGLDRKANAEALRREQLEAQRLQQAQLARLVELDRLKNDFLNAASHELRTPIMSIVGYAEFLEDELEGPLSAGQGEFVRQILLSAQRLQGLVDDLLDFARLEAGTFELALGTCELGALVRGEVASLQPQAREKAITLSLELPAGPCAVVADARRLGQVLLNLVGNAIKFTPEGGTVAVRLTPTAAGARLEVADSGIGIAAAHHGRLFEKFYQVDNTATRAHGGTGLGLAICQAIVTAHHGTIGVTSQPGEGATFWLELPAHPQADA